MEPDGNQADFEQDVDQVAPPAAERENRKKRPAVLAAGGLLVLAALTVLAVFVFGGGSADQPAEPAQPAARQEESAGTDIEADEVTDAPVDETDVTDVADEVDDGDDVVQPPPADPPDRRPDDPHNFGAIAKLNTVFSLSLGRAVDGGVGQSPGEIADNRQAVVDFFEWIGLSEEEVQDFMRAYEGLTSNSTVQKLATAISEEELVDFRTRYEAAVDGVLGELVSCGRDTGAGDDCYADVFNGFGREVVDMLQDFDLL